MKTTLKTLIRFVRPLGLVAGLLVSPVACSSSSETGPAGPYCGSSDPCGCVTPSPGETCAPNGAECRCTHAHDAEPPEAGVAEASASETSAFVGQWSPLSGTGQEDCGSGNVRALPPDTSAVLTFVEDAPGTLKATSSGAAGCTLTLSADGAGAALAEASESCDVPGGGAVSFTTFQLTPMVAGAPDDDAGAPPGDRLDWQLGDSDGTCTTTLHYTLVRVN